MSNPWRYRCPEGHVLARFGRETVHCESCGRPYPKEDAVDMKAGCPIGERSQT